MHFVSLLGMNAPQMCEYIECVADHLLVSLGFPKHYETSNPFPWMEMIGMQGKTNFRAPCRYTATGVATENNRSFSMDEDF